MILEGGHSEFLPWVIGILDVDNGYPPCSGRLRRMNRSTRASSLTKGPRKQLGGGRSDRRLATAGGGGKAPPETQQPFQDDYTEKTW